MNVIDERSGISGRRRRRREEWARVAAKSFDRQTGQRSRGTSGSEEIEEVSSRNSHSLDSHSAVLDYSQLFSAILSYSQRKDAKDRKARKDSELNLRER